MMNRLVRGWFGPRTVKSAEIGSIASASKALYLDFTRVCAIYFLRDTTGGPLHRAIIYLTDGQRFEIEGAVVKELWDCDAIAPAIGPLIVQDGEA